MVGHLLSISTTGLTDWAWVFAFCDGVLKPE